MDAEWMAYLGAFRNLRSLNVADCHRVTSSALWAMTGIVISYNYEDFSIFKKMKLQRTSYICLMFSLGLGMASLKELDLSRCLKVTDAGIRHVITISTLEKLRISETGLTVNGIPLLSSLKNLSILDLGGLPVTDQALCSLQVLRFVLIVNFF